MTDARTLSPQLRTSSLTTVSADTVIGQIKNAVDDHSAIPWSGGTVSYGFFETAPSNSYGSGEGTWGFESLTAGARTAVAGQLLRWGDAVDLNFQLVTGQTAQIMIGATNLFQWGAAGWAYFPQGNAQGLTEAGDFWIDVHHNDSNSFGNGINGQNINGFVVLHELGHTLGLDHAGDYNGSQGSREWTNDNFANSVMSYYNPWGELVTGWHKGNDEYFPQTPMIYDLVAAQAIYGVRAGVRAENSVYGYNSNVGDIYDFTANHTPILTIWDGGGYDTIDLSGSATAVKLSLVAGTSSDVEGLQYNLGIAFNTTIEVGIGGAGNDTLIGNSANNWLAGNGGNDRISADAGDDTLFGGSGTDTLTGGAGADVYVVSANSGNAIVTDYHLVDDFIGLNGVTYVSGGVVSGNLVLSFSNNSTLTLIGGSELQAVVDHMITVSTDPSSGADSNGGGGQDTTSADETITGTSDPDTLFGDDGNDVIYGLAGADSLSGGTGADTIFGGADNDTMLGGDGADVFVFASGDGADRITGYNGLEDRIVLDGLDLNGATQSGSTVHLTFSGGGSLDLTSQNLSRVLTTIYDADGHHVGLSLTGDNNNNTLSGGNTGEYISGLGGADRLLGNSGEDTLVGGTGNDYMLGGSGDDWFFYALGDGNDTIGDLNSRDHIQLDGVYATDLHRVSGGLGILLSDGSELTVNQRSIPAVVAAISVINVANDPNIGTLGNDTIDGDSSDNWIYGLSGNDKLGGSAGADTLDGGTGNDTLTGGSDADVFLVRVNGGQDVVTDFSSEDSIVLDGVALSTFTVSSLSNVLSSDVTGKLKLTFTGGSSLTLNSSPLETVFYQLGITVESQLKLGRTGADTLIGANGDDTAFGNRGNDVLNGLGGDDLLIGGVGADSLVGGAGADTLQFSRGDSGYTTSAVDKLIDFNADEDKIDFNSGVGVAVYDETGLSISGSSLTSAISQAVAAATGFDGNDAVLFELAGRTYLFVNNDGAGISTSLDLLLDVTGYTGTLDASDFV